MAAGCRKKVFTKMEDLGRYGRLAPKTTERLIGVDRCSACATPCLHAAEKHLCHQ